MKYFIDSQDNVGAYDMALSVRDLKDLQESGWTEVTQAEAEAATARRTEKYAATRAKAEAAEKAEVEASLEARVKALEAELSAAKEAKERAKDAYNEIMSSASVGTEVIVREALVVAPNGKKTSNKDVVKVEAGFEIGGVAK